MSTNDGCDFPGFSSGIGSGSVLPAPLLDRKLSGFGPGGSRVYTLGTTRGRQTTDVDHESLIACAVRPDVSSKWCMSNKEEDVSLHSVTFFITMNNFTLGCSCIKVAAGV